MFNGATESVLKVEPAELINYFRSLGLDVRTSTKARGHWGFYQRRRIEISKNISREKFVPTLVHEFAHFVHSQLEPMIDRSGGSLEVLFNERNANDMYGDELLAVTRFVDRNSRCDKLVLHRDILKQKISQYSDIIRVSYPDFQRSKDFKPFEKYIRFSRAKHLLKYDRVRIISGFLFKATQIISVDNIEIDFPDMPEEFCAFIRLNSCRKKQARISAKINKLNKYYERPTELFARFVEGLFIDISTVKNLAPNTYARFFELLNCGYYPHLSRVIGYLHLK